MRNVKIRIKKRKEKGFIVVHFLTVTMNRSTDDHYFAAGFQLCVNKQLIEIDAFAEFVFIDRDCIVDSRL
jgi:hypothetical protein